MEEDRLVDALAHARDAARAAPTDARAWHQLGLVLQAIGDLPKAAAVLERALTLAPGHATLLHLAARVALARGRDPWPLLERAHAARPSDPAIVLSQGMAHLAAAQPEAARAAFEAAIALAPNVPSTHASLASLAWQLGDTHGFDASYAAELAARPGNPALWNSWLSALIAARLPARALGVLARARAAVGEQSGFALAEVTARTDSGEVGEAGRLLAAVPPAADDAGYRIARIRHALRAGEIAAAAALAEDAVARGDGGDAWPYLATAWALLGDARADWLFGDERLVGVYDLSAELPPLADLADTLRRLHTTRVEPAEQSLRGGTQTDGDLLGREEPAIVALRAAIERAVAAYVAQLPPRDPAHPVLSRPRGPTRFNGSWSVRLVDAGFHVAHVHPRGWLSSAFYVTVPEAAPPQGWLKLGEPPADLGLGLPPTRRIEPVPGRLVLFPSILWHGTEPFANGERLSVAFDVVPLV